MIHDNDTMDVIMNGQLVRRPISHYERDPHMKMCNRAVPQLDEGEELVWTLGSHVPHVVKTR